MTSPDPNSEQESVDEVDDDVMMIATPGAEALPTGGDDEGVAPDR